MQLKKKKKKKDVQWGMHVFKKKVESKNCEYIYIYKKVSDVELIRLEFTVFNIDFNIV